MLEVNVAILMDFDAVSGRVLATPSAAILEPTAALKVSAKGFR